MAYDKDSDLKSFHTFLARLGNGGINELLTAALKRCVREVTDACCDRGGTHKARLTLTLDVVMDQKNKVIEIYPAIDEKLPKAPLGRSGMFYVTPEGELSRESPHQLSLDDELQRKRLQNAEATAGVASSG